MAEIREIRIPSIGKFSEVPVVEIFLSPGDAIDENQSLLALESEKAVMEIPSPLRGKLKKITVKEGDLVQEGTVVALVETADSSAVEVCIPDIGNFEKIPVVEIFVSEGDRIQQEDPILSLESEKAIMEIPAPLSGEVVKVLVEKGGAVSTGTPVALVAPLEGRAVEVQPERSAEPVAPAKTSLPPTPAQTETSSASPGQEGGAHASPAVRRLAREQGVDLKRLQGSGPKGRITKEDVLAASKESPPPISSSQRTVELSRIKRISGEHLKKSWREIPHVTHFEKADITELEAFRKSVNEERDASTDPSLTVLPFVMKAVTKTLAEHPTFNSSLSEDGKSLILNDQFNLGIAVDTKKGLVVPVVREVEKKKLKQLAIDLREISDRARAGGLSPEDFTGSGFTISSLGGIGGVGFTPLINAPEVAILGLSRAEVEPVWQKKKEAFVPRLMLPFSLSYDHRVIDGVQAARFCVFIKMILGDIRLLLL